MEYSLISVNECTHRHRERDIYTYNIIYMYTRIYIYMFHIFPIVILHLLPSKVFQLTDCFFLRFREDFGLGYADEILVTRQFLDEKQVAGWKLRCALGRLKTVTVGCSIQTFQAILKPKFSWDFDSK